MSENPKCCTPEMTLQEAAKLMQECDCGAIPVVENNESRKPIGIITDRDIACRAIAEGLDPKTTKVSECMTAQVECVSPEASVEDCCNKMESAQIRRMLVADDEGNLCGIVAQADIALGTSQRKTAEVVKCVSEPATTSA